MAHPPLDVSALVASMHETLSTIHTTIASLTTEPFDARLDALEQQRDAAIAAACTAFESEREMISKARKEKHEEIIERRRREDEERERIRKAEDEERESREKDEDEGREKELEERCEGMETEVDALMDGVEEEAEKVMREGREKLVQLEEKRKEINRLIDEQMNRPLPPIPTRARARTRTRGASLVEPQSKPSDIKLVENEGHENNTVEKPRELQPSGGEGGAREVPGEGETSAPGSVPLEEGQDGKQSNAAPEKAEVPLAEAVMEKEVPIDEPHNEEGEQTGIDAVNDEGSTNNLPQEDEFRSASPSVETVDTSRVEEPSSPITAAMSETNETPGSPILEEAPKIAEADEPTGTDDVAENVENDGEVVLDDEQAHETPVDEDHDQIPDSLPVEVAENTSSEEQVEATSTHPDVTPDDAHDENIIIAKEPTEAPDVDQRNEQEAHQPDENAEPDKVAEESAVEERDGSEENKENIPPLEASEVSSDTVQDTAEVNDVAMEPSAPVEEQDSQTHTEVVGDESHHDEEQDSDHSSAEPALPDVHQPEPEEFDLKSGTEPIPGTMTHGAEPVPEQTATPALEVAGGIDDEPSQPAVEEAADGLDEPKESSPALVPESHASNEADNEVIDDDQEGVATSDAVKAVDASNDAVADEERDIESISSNAISTANPENGEEESSPAPIADAEANPSEPKIPDDDVEMALDSAQVEPAESETIGNDDIGQAPSENGDDVDEPVSLALAEAAPQGVDDHVTEDGSEKQSEESHDKSLDGVSDDQSASPVSQDVTVETGEAPTAGDLVDDQARGPDIVAHASEVNDNHPTSPVVEVSQASEDSVNPVEAEADLSPDDRAPAVGDRDDETEVKVDDSAQSDREAETKVDLDGSEHAAINEVEDQPSEDHLDVEAAARDIEPRTEQKSAPIEVEAGLSPDKREADVDGHGDEPENLELDDDTQPEEEAEKTNDADASEHSAPNVDEESLAEAEHHAEDHLDASAAPKETEQPSQHHQNPVEEATEEMPPPEQKENIEFPESDIDGPDHLGEHSDVATPLPDEERDEAPILSQDRADVTGTELDSDSHGDQVNSQEDGAASLAEPAQSLGSLTPGTETDVFVTPMAIPEDADAGEFDAKEDTDETHQLHEVGMTVEAEDAQEAFPVMPTATIVDLDNSPSAHEYQRRFTVESESATTVDGHDDLFDDDDESEYEDQDQEAEADQDGSPRDYAVREEGDSIRQQEVVVAHASEPDAEDEPKTAVPPETAMSLPAEGNASHDDDDVQPTPTAEHGHVEVHDENPARPDSPTLDSGYRTESPQQDDDHAPRKHDIGQENTGEEQEESHTTPHLHPRENTVTDISPFSLRQPGTPANSVSSPYKGLAASRHAPHNQSPPQLEQTSHLSAEPTSPSRSPFSTASSPFIQDPAHNPHSRPHTPTGADPTPTSTSFPEEEVDPALFMPRDVTNVPWHARQDSVPMSLHSATTLSSAPSSPVHSSLARDNHEPVIRDSWPPQPRNSSVFDYNPNTMGAGGEYDPFRAGRYRDSISEGKSPPRAPYTDNETGPSTPPRGGEKGANGSPGSLFQKMRSIFEQPPAGAEQTSPVRSRPVSAAWLPAIARPHEGEEYERRSLLDGDDDGERRRVQG